MVGFGVGLVVWVMVSIFFIGVVVLILVWIVLFVECGLDEVIRVRELVCFFGFVILVVAVVWVVVEFRWVGFWDGWSGLGFSFVC